jgi:threonine synthase
MNSLRIEGQKTVGIEIVQQFEWAVPGLDHHSGGQPGQHQRAL